MNHETRQFIESEEFEKLYTDLHARHKPIKAQLRPDTLQDIGLLIVKFQRLEMTIRHLIAVLSEKLPEKDLLDILLHRTSFNGLINIMVSLSAKSRWKHHETLVELSKMANKAEEIRNQVVHSIWHSGGRMKTSLDKKGGGVALKQEEYEQGELGIIAAAIDKVDTAIDALSHRYIEDEIADGRTPPGVRVVPD